jgi:hypothetical protein
MRNGLYICLSLEFCKRSPYESHSRWDNHLPEGDAPALSDKIGKIGLYRHSHDHETERIDIHLSDF